MASHDDDFDLSDEDFDLDDWGLGDDLDGGDFLSESPAKDDRNPVLRLGGKFVSGLGKTFVDPNVQRRMIKDNLPDGFASAYDAGAVGIEAFNDIKREVDRNLGSIVSDAKSTLSKVSPTIEKQLPSALAKRLNEFTSKHGTTAYDSGNYNPEDQERQSGMSSFLEQVEAFKLKEESLKKNVMNKREARMVRSDAMQQRLLDAGNRAATHTNAILNRLLGYHTEVTTNFQMKSLELQYNQFFMLRKGVDLAEQQLSLSRDSYDKIIKNTGLPDALKLRTLEHAEFLAKEGILTKLNGKFNETVGSFVKKGVKQLGENISAKSEELKSAMAELESLVSMLDMLDGMEDEPPGAREQVMRQLETVFSFIGGIAGSKIEAIARKYATQRNLKGDSKLIGMSEKIKAFMGGGAQRINSFLSGDSDTGVDFLDNTIRGLIGGNAWSQDNKLADNKFDNLGESSFFDYRTKRTINDVIPGYLKLIHHELRMSRTGDESLAPISFDWQKNKFDDDKSIGKRLTEKLTGSGSVIASNAQSINKFINAIDPGKELSPETRKALGGLVSENMANGGSIFDVYSMMNNFNPQGPNAGKQRDELNAFMEKRGFDIYADTSNEIARFKTINSHDETANKFYNSFNKAMDQSRWDYESSNEEYQKLIDLGYGEHLEQAGLVIRDEDGGWSVNQQNIDKKTQRRAYKGFATGGWTGPGGKYQPKGFVHGDEFVVRSEVTKQPGVKGFLDQLNIVGAPMLNRLGGYAAGGEVQETSTTLDGNKAGVTLESIIEAIRTINPITYLKDMVQSVKGIEFSTMRNLMGNVEQLPQQMRSFYENSIKNARPGQTIKQQWDRFTERAKQNKIWDAIKGAGKDFKQGFNEGYDKMQARFEPSYLNAKFSHGEDATKYQADIYTEDDLENPKLTVDGFKNGEYFDELTGQPVTSAKDIKGTVVDKIGNIKLHAKDLGKKLISPSTYVKGILAGTRLTNTAIGKGFDTAVKFASKHDLWGKLKQGLKWSKSKLSHLNSDVYIEGREEPVLLVKDIKEGNLYNGERNQITEYNHIVGDIYDKGGNLVLAASEYEDKKLLGADGKPLKGFMRKQIRRVKNAAKLGWAGVKGFNQFRKKAWQAQFKLLYGIKDVAVGTRRKSADDHEAERYNEWMMQNANPDGKDQYKNSWERFKGKVSGFQKDTRDYLTGERDKRKAWESNVGQLQDHDGNNVEHKRDTFDKMSDWLKGHKDTAVSTLKERYGDAKTTAQSGIAKAKESAEDLTEKARLEAWYLKNTINNPDRDTGETLTGKAKSAMDGFMKKAKASIPEWMQGSSDDDEELKRYKKTLRKYWMQEQKEKFSGFANKAKAQAKKIDWKAAETKVKSLMPTEDDIRYQAKLFDMHLQDKGITKENIGKSISSATDKLRTKAKESIPAWLEEFTTDDDEVKRYKATLRSKWVEEQQAKLSGNVKKLKSKAKINWSNAKKQLESLMPDEKQQANFKAKATGAIDNLKKSTGSMIETGKSKFKEASSKWGLDKDEKGVENKTYRDKGLPRLIRDIHRLLDERLQKPKKGLWNDADGNGFREGSVEDQLADREKNKKDPKTEQVIVTEEKKKPKGILGLLMGLMSVVGGIGTAIATLAAKVMGFGKFAKEWMAKQAALKAAGALAGSGGCCCGGEGTDYNERKKGRKGRKGRKGKPGKGRTSPKSSRVPKGPNTATKLGTKLARGPGWMKVAGLAALGIGGTMAMSNSNASEVEDTEEDYDTIVDRETENIVKEQERGENEGFFNGVADTLGVNSTEGVANFAKDTAITTAGVAAVTGGISGALAGTGVAAGALAALGGPITLGIILGGAAIYGGIKLYQAMKDGDKPMLSFRMAQYGYKESSKSEIKSILKLEAELFKQTRVQGTSVAFTKPEVAVATAIQSLGINAQSNTQMKYFATWFNGRFKPVYFAWLAAINNVRKGLSLDKVDDAFKAQEKLDLMATVHSEVRSLGAYNVTTSFDAGKTLLNATAVDKLYKTQQNNVEDPKDRAGKEKAEATKQEMEAQKTTFWENTKNMFRSAGDTISNGWDKAKSTVSGWLGSAGNAISNGLSTAGTAISNGVTSVGNAISAGWEQVKAMSGTNKEKYNKIRAAAVQAGDPHPDIVAAQWALESGWGKKQSGKHNYFGIKAAKGEPGTAVRTREVYSGKNVMITDKFKDYASLEEGISDRVAFIKRNPRYTKSGYFAAKTPYQAAVALQKGGYATDPNYANLLCKIIKGCGYDPGAPSATNSSKAPDVKATKVADKPAVAPKNSVGIPITLAKPGTNNTGLSLDPSKKPNVSGMAMPGAPKSQASGAGILADPKKTQTVGNTMGNNDAKYANAKAVKAAKIATQKALGKSSGYCARYVANALQEAGYKFTRQNSAFMYHTNGIMKGMGFVAIDSTTYQIGDVAVWPAHGGTGGGGKHGHIQIYNGKSWVSDFLQKNFTPGKQYANSKPTIYRDKELLNSNVKIAVDSGKTASEMTTDNTVGDGETTSGSSSTAALNTKYKDMTIGDIIKKRNEAKVKIYGEDGTAKDYTFDPATGTGVTVKSEKGKTASANNPNNTSSKPTSIPTGPQTNAGVIGATAGGKAVDDKKDVINQQQAVKDANKSSGTNSSSPTAMRDAKMTTNATTVGNTSANYPAESIRLFTSMDSKLGQVVTALQKLAVISQDGIKAQVESSNRQAVALNETAKAVTTVATAAVSNKGGDESTKAKSSTPSLKPGVIGAGNPQPVSVLS